MTAVADLDAHVIAALLLAGGGHLRALDLPRPTVEQVIEATGASRSRAYELRDALLAVLPALQRPVGRPPAPPPSAPSHDTELALAHEVLRFVMDHPGCVYGGDERRRYDTAFHRYVVELRDRYAELPLERFAAATLVPLGTLKQWLDAGVVDVAAPVVKEDEPLQDDAEDTTQSASLGPQIEAVLEAHRTWTGSIGDFYEHVRHHLRIPFGRALIDRILFVHGEREPERRRGRCSSDERALRGAFETFFPGAQWVGDGSPIAVVLNDQRFVFNLELVVDAYSDGFVGLSVRDAEDSAAVTEAFDDATKTTGQPPLAFLLDNRPSNHTPEVDAALGDTLRIRATLYRPQNKAHVEGGFGLFQQAVPPLELHAHDPRELARQIVILVTQTWARTLNHRPRKDRLGRSRVELYNDKPDPDLVERARASLKERCHQQMLAHSSASARQDPVLQELLDDAFARLELLDPQRHFRVAIASYPLDAIVEGIAIFETRLRLGTLPLGVDARYLLGIVRNLHAMREDNAIALALLQARLDARDRLLAPLVRQRDEAPQRFHELHDRVLHFVDLALDAQRLLDRSFWLLAIADEINAHGRGDVTSLLRDVARRIHASFRLPRRERIDAVRLIVAKLAPLD